MPLRAEWERGHPTRHRCDVMLVQQVFYYSRQDTCRVRELSAGRMRESCTVGPPEPQNDSLVELLLPQELQGGPGLNLVQF